ncbi:hypothetical protein M0R45_026232 [Rubus argutus]|uniref:Uncharacterized protein n=1 Tax=Rubus argutus TaxID=59490 RepID=A0AAW1WWD4_RUBAR
MNATKGDRENHRWSLPLPCSAAPSSTTNPGRRCSPFSSPFLFKPSSRRRHQEPSSFAVDPNPSPAITAPTPTPQSPPRPASHTAQPEHSRALSRRCNSQSITVDPNPSPATTVLDPLSADFSPSRRLCYQPRSLSPPLLAIPFDSAVSSLSRALSLIPDLSLLLPLLLFILLS